MPEGASENYQIIEAARAGYQNLQWFWREVRKRLPSDQFLCLAAEENSVFREYLLPVAVKFL